MLCDARGRTVGVADGTRCGFDITSDGHTEPDTDANTDSECDGFAVADTITDDRTDGSADRRYNDPAGQPGPRDGRAHVQLDDRRVPGTRRSLVRARAARPDPHVPRR